MSYIMGQANVNGGTVITQMFVVPSGLCNVTFWNVSGVNVYVGTSTATTAANGLQCHSIPTNFFTYVGSKGATFYGLNTAATGNTATVNYIICNNF